MKRHNRILAACISAALAVPAASSAWAQDGAEGVIEEIVATGTRREGKSPTETLSPVDILGGELLTQQATFDMTDGVTKISPALKHPAVSNCRRHGVHSPGHAPQPRTRPHPGPRRWFASPPLAARQPAALAAWHRQHRRTGCRLFCNSVGRDQAR